MKILVTGSNGQLGKCFQELVFHKYTDLDVVFLNASELDITNQSQVENTFKSKNFDYCINCSAYTAVDKAETEKEKAFAVNAEGVKFLSQACDKYQTTFIHISTDFVFDGTKSTPYKETDTPNPINIYGLSKLTGENHIQEILERYFIIRTSWLYSEYGHNFVKTMLRLSKDKKQISVVGDQIGAPTYAKDLANMILDIIKNRQTAYGVYHYSNQGVASWYDFAKAIFDINNIEITLHKIKTEEFPTAAKRPSFSVLDTTKVQEQFKLKIPSWRDSLNELFS